MIAQSRASALLRDAFDVATATTDDLPQDLDDWIAASGRRATAAYHDYLSQRRAGAPSRFFSIRSHALYFLQPEAPTKLIDGSWLFGSLRYARDPRMT